MLLKSLLESNNHQHQNFHIMIVFKHNHFIQIDLVKRKIHLITIVGPFSTENLNFFSQVHMFEKWKQFSNNEGKLTWPHHHGYVDILNEEQVLHTLCYVFHKPLCFCFNILGPCACPLETTQSLPKGYVMW